MSRMDGKKTHTHTVNPFSPSRLMPAQTSVKREMDTVQYHPLCPNIVTAVLLLYILWTKFYPLDLCLSMCKEFIVHGIISHVVIENIVITTVL